MNALMIEFSLIFLVHLSNGEEPSCSKFDYDKRMLEMLVRMEADMKQRDEKQNTMEQELNQEKIFRTNLQEQLTDSISEVQELKNSLQSLSASLEVLNTELLDQKVKIDATLTQSMGTYSPKMFYFFMNHPKSAQLNGKMMFTRRTLSDDTWYDESTGVLTIQQDGLYYLSYTFVTSSDTVSPYCNLHLNNTEIIHNRGKGHYQSTTASVFKVLEKGDALDIRCYDGYYRHIHHGRATFFTGAMIRPGK